MPKIQRYVSYIVGTFLTIPLRVIHILPPEEKEKKPEERTFNPSELLTNSGQTKVRTQQGVKRTCGKAQKDARMKRQERINAKK